MTAIDSKRKTVKEIIKTSVPAVLDLSSQTFTWLIEAMFIGHLSTAALAGVGIAQQVIVLTFTVLLTFVMGSSIIVTRYLGARDSWNANHVLAQSLIVGVVLSLIIGVLWYFATPLIFTVIREREPVAQVYAINYITTIAWFAPLIVTNFIALGIMRGAGDTLITMKINLSANLLNLLLDVVLIFGYLGFPRLETTGAGLAVGIAHSAAFIATVLVLRSRKSSLFLPMMEVTRPNFQTFRRLVKVGIPTTVEQMIWSVGQLVMSVYAGWLGIVYLATHQVLVRIQSLLTMIFFGFGIGAMTMVGKNLGADQARQARRTGRLNGLVGFLAAAGIALVLFVFAEPIISVFTNDPAVQDLGISLITVFALIQMPKGANIVYTGSLRGTADLNWLMWLAVASAIGFEIIGSWVLAIPMGFGLFGLWIIQGVDEFTRLSLNYWRFNKGNYREVKL